MTIHTTHGAVGLVDDWACLSKSFVEYGFLMRHHNLWSFLSEGGLSYGAFAECLNDAVEDVKDESRCLLGYSMGGRLALHALIHDQQLGDRVWDKAVIVSAHTGIVGKSARLDRTNSDEKWASLAENLSWVEFIKEWNSQGVLKNERGSELLGLADRSKLMTQRAAIAESFRCWSLGRQKDLLGELSQLETPVLWVVGELDHKFCAIAEKAVSILPNAELKIVKNAGHRVPWEAPDDFNALVREWLEK